MMKTLGLKRDLAKYYHEPPFYIFRILLRFDSCSNPIATDYG